MLRNIYLYGYLAEKYGKVHKFAVNSIGEVMRAMEANFPGFRNDIERDKLYHVACGEEIAENTCMDDTTVFMNYNKGDFHISPEISGAGGNVGSILMGVLGVVLMVVSIWVPPAGLLGMKLITGALVFGVGLSLFASGIMGMLTPTPTGGDYGSREEADERPSYLFNGPVNTTQQGGPVPLIYGEVLIGSTIISTSLDVEDI